MSTHNVCFNEENQKKSHNHHQIHVRPLLIFVLTGILNSRQSYFTTNFPSNFEKPKRTVR